MVDVVCVPNALLTVQSGRNSKIYLKEEATIGDTIETRLWYPEIPQGYYTVESLRLAIQDALNGSDRFLPGAYEVTYNQLTTRFEFTTMLLYLMVASCSTQRNHW